MRRVTSVVVVLLLVGSSARAESPPKGESPAGSSVARTAADVLAARPHRFEPIGLSQLRPYERGKVPVVFVHGLWLRPSSWSQMLAALDADEALRGRYQFWTYGYSTGDPIPYSASLFRRDLQDARRKFDADRTDAAFDRMVVVGHSMGGLLSKMMVQDSGERLWRAVSDRPIDDLAGDASDRELLRQALIFTPRAEVRRLVLIATPHRGSRVDSGHVERIGMHLVRLPDPLRAAHNRLVAANEPLFFNERFRKGLPSSIDELEWKSPILMGLVDLGLPPAVKVHSIIADRRNPPLAGGTDGVVPYESAHLDAVTSERLVSSGHLCQDNADVISEVRRILAEHATGDIANPVGAASPAARAEARP